MFQVQEKCSKCGKTFTPQMVDWYNEPTCPDCAEEYVNSVTTNTDGDITTITTKGKILNEMFPCFSASQSYSFACFLPAVRLAFLLRRLLLRNHPN